MLVWWRVETIGLPSNCLMFLPSSLTAQTWISLQEGGLTDIGVLR